MTLPTPFDPAFWTAEERAFWEQMAPLVMQILLKGAEAGLMALPPEVQILMNWDTFNQAAVDYLRGYRASWIKGISETTRKQIMAAISAWIQAGEPLPLLTARLEMLDGINARRAKIIATTEVTRVYAEANRLAWQASGVVGSMRWQTARDELVCPICAPLHGMEAELNGNGFTTEPGGIGPQGPPLHPRCRCWLQPVVSLDLLERELEAILAAP